MSNFRYINKLFPNFDSIRRNDVEKILLKVKRKEDIEQNINDPITQNGFFEHMTRFLYETYCFASIVYSKG